MQKLSEYLPSMELDGYSCRLCQERVDKCHTQGFFHPFTYSHLWALMISNSLLSMMKASLALVTDCFSHLSNVPDKARMNNHRASYLVSIRLILAFYVNTMQIWH